VHWQKRYKVFNYRPLKFRKAVAHALCGIIRLRNLSNSHTVKLSVLRRLQRETLRYAGSKPLHPPLSDPTAKHNCSLCSMPC
jgi:hypothetical protein